MTTAISSTKKNVTAGCATYKPLDKAIVKAGGVTPCRDIDAFTADVQHPLDSIALIKICQTSCPVFGQCRDTARALPAAVRAGSVLGGERYDLLGALVPLGQLQNEADLWATSLEVDQDVDADVEEETAA
jgi:hypothetical protein